MKKVLIRLLLWFFFAAAVQAALKERTVEIQSQPEWFMSFTLRCPDEEKVDILEASFDFFKNCSNQQLHSLLQELIDTNTTFYSDIVCVRVDDFNECLTPLVSSMKACTDGAVAADLDETHAALLKMAKFACDSGAAQRFFKGTAGLPCSTSLTNEVRACFEPPLEILRTGLEHHVPYLTTSNCWVFEKAKHCALSKMRTCIPESLVGDFREVLGSAICNKFPSEPSSVDPLGSVATLLLISGALLISTGLL